jgi:hypothetical protein
MHYARPIGITGTSPVMTSNVLQHGNANVAGKRGARTTAAA